MFGRFSSHDGRPTETYKFSKMYLPPKHFQFNTNRSPSPVRPGIGDGSEVENGTGATGPAIASVQTQEQASPPNTESNPPNTFNSISKGIALVDRTDPLSIKSPVVQVTSKSSTNGDHEEPLHPPMARQSSQQLPENNIISKSFTSATERRTLDDLVPESESDDTDFLLAPGGNESESDTELPWSTFNLYASKDIPLTPSMRRQPRAQGQWWTIIQQAWAAMGDPRRRIVTLTGLMMETEHGQTQNPCRTCLEIGSTCRNFKLSAREGLNCYTDRCAQCMFRQVSCTLVVGGAAHQRLHADEKPAPKPKATTKPKPKQPEKTDEADTGRPKRATAFVGSMDMTVHRRTSARQTPAKQSQSKPDINLQRKRQRPSDAEIAASARKRFEGRGFTDGFKNLDAAHFGKRGGESSASPIESPADMDPPARLSKSHSKKAPNAPAAPAAPAQSSAVSNHNNTSTSKSYTGNDEHVKEIERKFRKRVRQLEGENKRQKLEIDYLQKALRLERELRTDGSDEDEDAAMD
ncbi:hypothetical protein BT63DRAFT_452969 [Microthyrium microscopicum]|uniref:Uncharacterized protein n=1 Tax=Microthyrium microscopicum TaxID=703497 RepID=A0A6A6ULY2_9PEZI|nr:hypothetical protein BT63DRAFT_452969 [Microthyrium microscopicum]